MEGVYLKAVIMAVAYGVAARGSTWSAGIAIDPTAVSILGIHYLLDDGTPLVRAALAPSSVIGTGTDGRPRH